MQQPNEDAQRSRLRVLEAALTVMARHGYVDTTFDKIAEEAGVPVAVACRYFPTKEMLGLSIYERNAHDLEAWATTEMPEGTIGDRFQAAMHAKLALFEPHRRAITALVLHALDPDVKDSALGPAAETTRSRFSAVFSLVVRGATDAPEDAEAAPLARMLYGLHLALILLWTQDRTDDRRITTDAIALAAKGLTLGRPMLSPALQSPVARRVDALFGNSLRSSADSRESGVARIILERVFRRRRVYPGVPITPSESALTLHLPRVEHFMRAGAPVQLVLPAFPAKAPNHQKVLGPLPDTAEYLALQSLCELLDEITEAYRPGAELIICSDGHVFADVVHVPDSDVATYRRHLERMIDGLGRGRIRFFGLEDAFGSMTPEGARRTLAERYAQSVDEIRDRASRSRVHAAQLDGIHRFLFEDEVVRSPELSRTQARKQTREVAYEVVRRSDAWGRLVSAVFPEALRLSIHPQPDVSEKIGIHMLPTDDAWLTPWHGVAVLHKDRFQLMKRADAEGLGAVIVEEHGRASHMEVRA